MEIRLDGICLDCGDAEEMARFYASVFGWTETARDDVASRQGGTGWISMSGPRGAQPSRFRLSDGTSRRR